MGLPERVFPVIDWVFPCCIFRVRRARVPGGKVSAAEIVPEMQSGAMLIGLDPAAPHAGRLPERQDVSYFFSHPSHPPIFNDETEAEARRDFFGGVAKQWIVRALLQGPEEDYAKGEVIASKLFGPILRSHRISIEQVAILEPAFLRR